MEQYWKIEYTDIFEGITFKFKQLNPVEHIGLVTKNIEFEQMDGDKADFFIQKSLQSTLWSKDGKTWNTLIDEGGNAKLPELATNPSIALDLFYKFKKDVLYPVFSESKTFQSIIEAQKTQKLD